MDETMSHRQLYFIQHSSFLYVGEGCLLLFDYYGAGDVLSLLDRLPKYPLYIFCSHSHGDHYSPVVHTLFKNYPEQVRYIFHQEVWESVPEEYRDDIRFLNTEEEITIDGLKVRALGSTDAGGSFYVEENGLRLFHAGDLNNWHWNEEASPYYIQLYEEAWQKELTLAQEHISGLELLMFPTDLRLGKDFLKGLEQFLGVIPTKYIVPMHLNGVLEDYRVIKKECQKHHTQLLIPHPLREITIP